MINGVEANVTYIRYLITWWCNRIMFREDIFRLVEVVWKHSILIGGNDIVFMPTYQVKCALAICNHHSSIFLSKSKLSSWCELYPCKNRNINHIKLIVHIAMKLICLQSHMTLTEVSYQDVSHMLKRYLLLELHHVSQTVGVAWFFCIL